MQIYLQLLFYLTEDIQIIITYCSCIKLTLHDKNFLNRIHQVIFRKVKGIKKRTSTEVSKSCLVSFKNKIYINIHYCNIF